MNKSSGVRYISHKRSAAEQGSNSLVTTEIAKEVTRDLSELIQGMFDGIDDSLFELANSARSNNDQNRFFEAMREIRIKRKGIESQFSRNILAQFESHAILNEEHIGRRDNIERLDNFSIVANEGLEEEVAISTLVSKAEANFQSELLKFQARIGRVFGQDPHTQITPPLQPKTICHVFAEACKTLEIEIKEKLIVLKQFDRYVISNLGQVLEHANRILVRHGVLPQLKTPGIRHTHSHSAEQTMESPNIEVPSPEELNSDVFPELQSLLANMRQSAQLAQTKPDADQQKNKGFVGDHNAIDTSSLLALLTQLQKQPSASSPISKDAKVIDIRSALQQLANGKLGQHETKTALSKVDDDLINLVAMLFEFILEDYNLAPPVQVLISRLQIPILKVVLQDKSFFSSSKHPARQLLNSLARAGISWGESSDQSRDQLFARIEQVVHQVLEEFDGDTSLFTRLNNDFVNFVAQEERKAKVVEQRTKEAEKGRARSRQAQATVEEAISNKILNARHPIPSAVADMLKNGWSRVMFLAYLKDEREHQWDTAMKIADELIWCLQPLTDTKDRQRWVAIVPKLLKDLKSGLESVSYSADVLDEMMQDVKQELTSAFKNPENILTGTEQTQHSRKRNLSSAVQKQLGSRDDKIEQFLQQIDEVQVGQWVEFQLINGSKFRCKLSAKLDEADCLIFVNRMGLKTVEKKRIELAQDLAAGKLRILEQGQVIDRALSAVMSNLRQNSSS